MHKVLFLYFLLSLSGTFSSCSDSERSEEELREIAKENITNRMRSEVLNPASLECEGLGPFDTITLEEELKNKIAGLEYDLNLNNRYIEKLEEAIGREATGFRKFKDQENRRIRKKMDSLQSVLEQTPGDEIVYIRTRFVYRSRNRNGSTIKDSAWIFLNPDLSVKLVID